MGHEVFSVVSWDDITFEINQRKFNLKRTWAVLDFILANMVVNYAAFGPTLNKYQSRERW